MDAPDKREPIALRPGGALFLVFLFFAAFMSALLILQPPTQDNIAGALVFQAAGAVGMLMAMYIGLNRHAPNEATLSALRLSRPSRNIVAFLYLGAVAGIALGPLGELALEWMLHLWPLPGLAEQQKKITEAMASDTVALVVTTVSAVTVLPFLEEAFFRGLMQPNLEKTIGAKRAVIVTVILCMLPSLLFPRIVPMRLLAVVPMGLLAVWSRSTWPAVCGHIAFQASPYLFSWLGVKLVHTGTDGTRFLSWGWVLLLSGGAVAILAIARSGRLAEKTDT